MSETTEVIARLTPSPFRRAAAIVFCGGLGVICLTLILIRPPAEPVWIVVLLIIAVGALWLAGKLSAATRTSIELTRDGLSDSHGRVLAPLRQIAAVERGAFAFKPSNGFLVRLSEPAARAWQPGLWWRFGRRLGIGGVTPSAQGRLMADTLSALLVERDRNREG